MERIQQPLEGRRVSPGRSLERDHAQPAAAIKPAEYPRRGRADAAIRVVQDGERTRYHDVTNMASKLDTVKYQVSESVDGTDVEAIRRQFAAAWGQMGAAWGVPPSTAAV